jgi:hypothetical protein
VWELSLQHCSQVVAGFRGEVWSLDVDSAEERLAVGEWGLPACLPAWQWVSGGCLPACLPGRDCCLPPQAACLACGAAALLADVDVAMWIKLGHNMN